VPERITAPDDQQKHTLAALLFDGTSCGEMLVKSRDVV
jgi:hypothetical protein